MTRPRNLANRARDIVYVTDFGAVGDGTTDDTAAIQLALNAGSTILFPVGTYKVTSGLTIPSTGTHLKGVGTPVFGSIAHIVLSSITPQAVFTTAGQACSFKDLYIDAGTTTSGYIGIKLGPTSGAADRDCYFTNCNIQNADSAIYSYGRGVYVENCVLASLQNGVVLDWPNPFTPGANPDQTTFTGFRAITVRDCRIQALSGTVVRNLGTNAQNMTGLTFTGNYCDGNNGVIYGSVRNATFTGNTFIDCASIVFHLNYVDGLTITGNTFAGMYDNTGNVTTRHTADITNLIYLEAGFTAQGITVSGNTISHLYQDGIFLNGTWNNVTVVGNVWNDALRGNNDASLNPNYYGIVRTNTNGSGLTVAHNVCDVGLWARNVCLVNSGGSTVTLWTVHSNVFNVANIAEQNLGTILSPNDYAIGTFTPTLITSGVAFTSITYNTLVSAKYVRIGKVVNIQGYMSTDAITKGPATGNIQIGNLPFTCGPATSGKNDGAAPVTIGAVSGFLADSPDGGQVRTSDTKIDLYKRATANGAITNVVVADLATGAGANAFGFSATYLIS